MAANCTISKSILFLESTPSKCTILERGSGNCTMFINCGKTLSSPFLSSPSRKKRTVKMRGKEGERTGPKRLRN